ncbi:MAG: PqqD family protein [Gammaproteobacteria bacterium]|nr:PqqD family protein [Gammaproteobacteria bacterium]
MHETAGNETISLTDQVRFRAVGEDGVLVHLESGRVIVVNEIGLHIVQQLNESKTRVDLTSSIVLEFEVSIEQAETDLDAFLAELDQEQILVRPQ